jgi:glycosyltransferase involved in cell wall biosynthesis
MIRKAFSRLPAVAHYRKTIAVDLTPARPANGLEPSTARALVQALCDLQPQWRWVLLTTPATHDDYADLERGNASRQCLTPHKPELRGPVGLPPPLSRWRRAVRKVLGLSRVPRPPHALCTETVLRHLQADLLFCPFGATQVSDPAVPTVALWNNLSHVEHPQLLPPAERSAVSHAFKETVRLAERVVCFSEGACRVLAGEDGVPAGRITALRVELMQRPQRPAAAAILARLSLRPGQFLYFPAAFTAPNNHKLLLVAFAMLQRRRTGDCQLVCGGPAGDGVVELQAAVRRMGLAGQVLVCPDLDGADDAALLQACRAVVFPWLEGSRCQSLLQAVALGKPVLCSDLASLPEFLREAVFLFDPRKPATLVEVLERASADTGLLAALAQSSQRQARALGGPRDLARRILGIIHEALRGIQRFTDTLKSIYPDGWTTERLLISFAAGVGPRRLRLALESPPWLPWAFQRIRLLGRRGKRATTYKLHRGRGLTIERALPVEGGMLELVFDPPLIPQALGLSDDARFLGCMCTECVLVGPGGEQQLYPVPAEAAVAA